jgi:hypothetical protein
VAVRYHTVQDYTLPNAYYTTSGYVSYPAENVKLHTDFPERTDRVNLTIRTVELKAGWVGQVKNGSVIIWESKPKKSGLKAEKAAVKAKDRAIARLFEDN